METENSIGQTGGDKLTGTNATGQTNGDKLSPRQIISDYMREQAKKSHERVKEKYGREHFVKMGQTKHKRGGKKANPA